MINFEDLKKDMQSLIKAAQSLVDKIEALAEVKYGTNDAGVSGNQEPEIPYGWVELEDGEAWNPRYKWLHNINHTWGDLGEVYKDSNRLVKYRKEINSKIIKPIPVPEGYELMPKWTMPEPTDKIKAIKNGIKWVSAEYLWDMIIQDGWYVARPIKAEFNPDWWKHEKDFLAASRMNMRPCRFETEQEGERYREWWVENEGRIRSTQKVESRIAELNDGWVPHWNKATEYYCFSFDSLRKEAVVKSFSSLKYLPNAQYMKSREIALQVLSELEPYIRQMLS